MGYCLPIPNSFHPIRILSQESKNRRIQQHPFHTHVVSIHYTEEQNKPCLWMRGGGGNEAIQKNVPFLAILILPLPPPLPPPTSITIPLSPISYSSPVCLLSSHMQIIKIHVRMVWVSSTMFMISSKSIPLCLFVCCSQVCPSSIIFIFIFMTSNPIIGCHNDHLPIHHHHHPSPSPSPSPPSHFHHATII